MSGAVGVAIAEDNRSGTIGIKACGAVHKHGDDAVAAYVGNGVGDRSCHIHQASYGSAIISRHSGNDIRQSNVEGERPVLTMFCAVGVTVGIYDVSLTAVEASAVNSDITGRERFVAGIGD